MAKSKNTTTGARLQLQRIRTPKKCLQCGKVTNQLKIGKYCSQACTSKAYRQRKKENGKSKIAAMVN